MEYTNRSHCGFEWIGNIKKKALSTVEQHFFGLVDLGGQISRSSVIGVVGHHQHSMPSLDGRVVHLVHYTDDQLCLSESHGGVETSRVHSEGVKVAATADVPVHFYGAFDCCIVRGLLRPRVMRLTPSVVLIINN